MRWIVFAMVLLAGCTQSFEEQRTGVLTELQLAIEDAEDQGLYSCCIEPACTMCYLGNWLWEDGVCRCDEMIAAGDFESVCPQCHNGDSCESESEFICEA